MQQNNFWFKIFVSIFLLSLALFVYFLMAPVVVDLRNVFTPRRLHSIEYARNYYSVVGIFITAFFSFSGLVLGAFYYFNRKTYDEYHKKKDLLGKRQEKLFAELNDYNNKVHKILVLAVSDENELRLLRLKIEIIFENIELMIEDNERIGLTNDDVDAILRLNSFVDKCDLLKHKPLDSLSVNELYPIKDRFVELMKNAKQGWYFST